MSSILPPSPQGVPPGHAFWNVWYEKLRAIINDIATSIQWVNLNFAGSKIEDIVSRQHNKLQSMDGGTTNEYYHLTSAQHTRATAIANPDITSTSLDMTIQPKAPGAAEHGGTLTIQGRDAVGAAYNGGGFVLQSGDGGSAGFGGDFTLASGGGDSGGQVNVSGGAGVTAGGGVSFIAGDASGAGGLGANVSFQAGNAVDAAGLGGSINLVSGFGGLTSGSVVLRGANGFYGLEVADDGSGAMVALFGAAPAYQPTTAITGASFTAGAGTTVNSNSTFGGYKITQIVAALQAVGILA